MEDEAENARIWLCDSPMSDNVFASNGLFVAEEGNMSDENGRCIVGAKERDVSVLDVVDLFGSIISMTGSEERDFI
jgi:hypothetical protein